MRLGFSEEEISGMTKEQLKVWKANREQTGSEIPASERRESE
jgi:hypothetical protein